MTTYKPCILPHVLVGSAALASVFAMRIPARIRDKRKGRQKEELANGDDEGGSAVAADVAAPRS